MRTGHVGLNVSDLQRSLSFYETALGFQVLSQSQEEGRKYAFLGEAGQLRLTLWEQSTGKFATNQPGLHHLAFQVDSIEDVKRREEHLRSLGVEFIYEGIVPHSETAESGGIFFLDPDGIRLEIYTAQGTRAHARTATDGRACGFF
jgi:lactoylglutathione lyase